MRWFRVAFDPSHYRVLLAGPKVSRLAQLFAQNGYVVDVCTTGAEAVRLAQKTQRHLLVLELELDDMMGFDLIKTLRDKAEVGAVLLVEDPIKSGMIVSTLSSSVDAYASLPPDEPRLFHAVERLLKAQWADEHLDEGSRMEDNLRRLERAVQTERNNTKGFVRELGELRHENAELKKQLARANGSGLVSPPPPPRAAPNDFDDELDRPTDQSHRGAGAGAGFDIPRTRSGADTDDVPLPPALQRTRASPPPAAGNTVRDVRPRLDESNEADLFLSVEDDEMNEKTSTVVNTGARATAPTVADDGGDSED